MIPALKGRHSVLQALPARLVCQGSSARAGGRAFRVAPFQGCAPGRSAGFPGRSGDFIGAVIACEIRSYASNIVVWPPGEPKPIRGRDIRRDSGWVFPAGIRTYATDEISWMPRAGLLRPLRGKTSHPASAAASEGEWHPVPVMMLKSLQNSRFQMETIPES